MRLATKSSRTWQERYPARRSAGHFMAALRASRYCSFLGSTLTLLAPPRFLPLSIARGGVRQGIQSAPLQSLFVERWSGRQNRPFANKFDVPWRERCDGSKDLSQGTTPIGVSSSWLTSIRIWRLPFTEDEFLSILNRLTGKDTRDLESLLKNCREVATRFFRNREDSFRTIEHKLINIYRLATLRSIQRDFPLLIVDEAHNWKNGPQSGANGFFEFRDFIAPHVRRSLLLTVTPFQLRPDEILEILKVSDEMRPCPTQAESSVRVERLKKFREQTIRPVLANAESHSRHFSRPWVRIPRRVTAQALDEGWNSPSLAIAREGIVTLANLDGVIADHGADLAIIILGAVAGIDPDIRQFLREALHLFAYNTDLSRELGKLVVRHRRQTDHRFFLVGAEYGQAMPQLLSRPDSHILHAAPGLDIRGEAELPQYLLMRCVSEMKGGKGRSSLGSDLTGCYSTLHASAEGLRLVTRTPPSPAVIRSFAYRTPPTTERFLLSSVMFRSAGAVPPAPAALWLVASLMFASSVGPRSSGRFSLKA